MARARYPWWAFVLNVIRLYPKLENRKPNIVPSSEGMPGGSEISRPTERYSLSDKDSEYIDAVKQAIETSDDLTVEIIRLVYWKRSHTLHGAAMKVNVSYMTARRRQRVFIFTVAKKLNLI